MIDAQFCLTRVFVGSHRGGTHSLKLIFLSAVDSLYVTLQHHYQKCNEDISEAVRIGIFLALLSEIFIKIYQFFHSCVRKINKAYTVLNTMHIDRRLMSENVDTVDIDDDGISSSCCKWRRLSSIYQLDDEKTSIDGASDTAMSLSTVSPDDVDSCLHRTATLPRQSVSSSVLTVENSAEIDRWNFASLGSLSSPGPDAAVMPSCTVDGEELSDVETIYSVQVCKSFLSVHLPIFV